MGLINKSPSVFKSRFSILIHHRSLSCYDEAGSFLRESCDWNEWLLSIQMSIYTSSLLRGSSQERANAAASTTKERDSGQEKEKKMIEICVSER